MQSIRVAAVSMNSELGKYEETFAKIEQYAAQATEQGAELILFPELVVHGHCTPNTFDVAEAVPEGPSTQRLEKLAAKLGVVLSVGLSEKENDIVYNTQALIGPDGYIGKQRKIHTSRDESFFYKGGREMPVFNIGKCKVGMIICYDNQFPEIARILALRGADILLMPHAARQGQWDENSPESEAKARKHVFDFFVSCYGMRARENACYVVMTDQAGKAGVVDLYPPDHFNQPNHPGASLIFGPDGSLLKHAQTEKIQDEIIIHDLDAELMSKVRSHPNYTLRVRRPELFGELVNDQVSC